jgi:hypothetical protein
MNELNEPKTTLIRSITPKREWLLRCADEDGKASVCAIGVSGGKIEITGPSDDVTVLDFSAIADFHEALHAAIELAEDLRRQELGQSPA